MHGNYNFCQFKDSDVRSNIGKCKQLSKMFRFWTVVLKIPPSLSSPSGETPRCGTFVYQRAPNFLKDNSWQLMWATTQKTIWTGYLTKLIWSHPHFLSLKAGEELWARLCPLAQPPLLHSWGGGCDTVLQSRLLSSCSPGAIWMLPETEVHEGLPP